MDFYNKICYNTKKLIMHINYIIVLLKVIGLLFFLCSVYCTFQLARKFGTSFLFEKNIRILKAKSYRKKRQHFVACTVVLIIAYMITVITYLFYDDTLSLTQLLQEIVFYLVILLLTVVITAYIAKRKFRKKISMI